MFKATVNGKTYSDPMLFEADCKAAGMRKTTGSENAALVRSTMKKWKTPSRKAFSPSGYDIGSEVVFTLDGRTVRGQVWSRTYKPNTVFVADGQDFYVVNVKTNGVYADRHEGRQPAVECVGYYAPVAYAAA